MAFCTYSAYRQIMNNLPEDHCLLILDFAENYNCKVYREVQSLHWITVRATLLIIVVIRHPLPADGERHNGGRPHARCVVSGPWA